MLFLSGGTRKKDLLWRLVKALKAIYAEIIGLVSTEKLKTVIATCGPYEMNCHYQFRCLFQQAITIMWV